MTTVTEEPQTSTPLLQVDRLRVSYGGVVAVNDVTLKIEPGRIVGLIGPNGAGKTSFVDGLTGYAATSGGAITLNGLEVTKLRAHKRARAGIVRTFQSVELFDDLTVRENVLIGGQDPRILRALAQLVVPGRAVSEESVDWALDVMGLFDVGDRMPTELSFGRRKKAGVARAIARRPPLLLLDEPAAGLDPEETKELGQRLSELPGQGIGVLLIDHDMSLVLEICDEVYVLDFGQLIAHGTPQEIRTNQDVINAYLGSEDHE
jgi:branched-chain amino acid transport system ATP-binding protein